MTELVNMVRAADALLHARVQVGEAAQASNAWLFRGRGARTAATKLEGAAGSAARAVELLRDAPTTTRATARVAVDAVEQLRTSASGQSRQLADVARPTLEILDDAHASVLATFDDAVEPTDPVALRTWTRARTLVERGVELPPSLRDTARANVDSTLVTDPVTRAAEVMRPHLDSMTGEDLLELERLIRASRSLVTTLPDLSADELRQLERAARLVEQGVDLPAGWSVRPKLEESRGRTIWSTMAVARDHVREIVWGPNRELTPDQLGDLRSIAHLPDDLRPGDIPRDLPLETIDDATLNMIRAGFADDKTIELVRTNLHLVTDKLVEALKRPTSDMRHVLTPLRDELNRFRGLPLQDADRKLADKAMELLDLNLGRQNGTIASGGYGRWADLGELGQARANLELINRLGEVQSDERRAATAVANGDAAAVESGGAPWVVADDTVDVVDDAGDDAALNW